MLNHNEHTGVARELKLIRLLIMTSVGVHGISIAGIAVLTVFQVPIGRLLGGFRYTDNFMLPSGIYIATVLVFLACHGLLAWGLMRAMEGINLSRLQNISVIAIIFVILVRPVLDNVSQRVNFFFITRLGSERLAHTLMTMSMLSYGLALRNVSLMILLVAASMMLYYCYVRRIKGLNW